MDRYIEIFNLKKSYPLGGKKKQEFKFAFVLLFVLRNRKKETKILFPPKNNSVNKPIFKIHLYSKYMFLYIVYRFTMN